MCTYSAYTPHVQSSAITYRTLNNSFLIGCAFFPPLGSHNLARLPHHKQIKPEPHVCSHNSWYVLITNYNKCNMSMFIYLYLFEIWSAKNIIIINQRNPKKNTSANVLQHLRDWSAQAPKQTIEVHPPWTNIWIHIKLWQNDKAEAQNYQWNWNWKLKLKQSWPGSHQAAFSWDEPLCIWNDCSNWTTLNAELCLSWIVWYVLHPVFVKLKCLSLNSIELN